MILNCLNGGFQKTFGIQDIDQKIFCAQKKKFVFYYNFFFFIYIYSATNYGKTSLWSELNKNKPTYILLKLIKRKGWMQNSLLLLLFSCMLLFYMLHLNCFLLIAIGKQKLEREFGLNRTLNWSIVKKSFDLSMLNAAWTRTRFCIKYNILVFLS